MKRTNTSCLQKVYIYIYIPPSCSCSVHYLIRSPERAFTWTRTCEPVAGPTGTTMRPPGFSCCTSSSGILSAAAPTCMASKGPYSAQPFHPSPVCACKRFKFDYMSNMTLIEKKEKKAFSYHQLITHTHTHTYLQAHISWAQQLRIVPVKIGFRQGYQVRDIVL